MKRYLLPLACALWLMPSAAQAQVSLHIDIGLPAAPPLVEVQPGIQVVEGFQDEVFFNAGWYWCRRPDGWYRSRSPRARFDWVDRRYVPMGLMRMPSGRYRNWHHGGPMGGPERRMDPHGPMGGPERRMDPHGPGGGPERRMDPHGPRGEEPRDRRP